MIHPFAFLYENLILGFIHRPAKFQKLGLAPSNSLKFLTRLRRVNARLILNLFPK